MSDRITEHRPRRRIAGIAAVCIALSLAAPARAATLDLTTATIGEVQAAFATGKLTSAKLIEAYIARIKAYDKQGPAINAVIMMNPKAMAEAKALDAERRHGKVRGPLHGVPIILKDNYNTFDMPTTAGSQLLKGSIPPADATVVKKLREAGVVIVAKVNLNEFAGSGGMVDEATDPEVVKAGRAPSGFSSMGGQTHNPHALDRVPSSSSGGTGASIAAAFAQFGLGSDTGGSIRGPASVNGIAGLKTTYGLVSRNGIVPLALSLDTSGPMARSVTDIAYAMNVLAGPDAADPASQAGAVHVEDYTKYLHAGSLKGVRIGIVPHFMGTDEGTKKIAAAAVETLKRLGAVIVEPIEFPTYLLAPGISVYDLVVNSEFKAQINEYLKTLKPGFPKTYDEIVALANDPATGYRSPQKANGLKHSAARAMDMDDPVYLNLKNEVLPTLRAGVAAVFTKYKIDALFFPTSGSPAGLIADPPKPYPTLREGSPGLLTNEAWVPEMVVPAGMTDNGLPVTMSFLGPMWSDAKLIGYAYDFEQATKGRHLPKFTPSLPSDKITY